MPPEKMTEATIPLVDSHRALSLFGARDQHVRTIREALGVSITHRDGEIRVPNKPGLGIEIDFDQIEQAHELYLEKALGGRDDTAAMQYLMPGWTFDPKRPCLVR